MIGKLNHVGVATPSIEAAVKMYRDMLGATDIGEKENLAAQEPERTAAMRARLAEFLKDAVVPGHVDHEANALMPPKKKAR